MTTPSFIQLIYSLSESVDKVNLELIDNVTSESTNYKMACIKPNITAENYFKSLKREWEKVVLFHMEDKNKCSSITSRAISIIQSSNLSNIDIKNLDASKIEELIIDNLIDKIILPSKREIFSVDVDLTKTLLSLINVLKQGFFCQIFDIYVYVMDKYRDKFRDRLTEIDRSFIKNTIIQQLDSFKQAILNTNRDVMIGGKIALENDLVNKLTGIYNFSVEGELNRLIPEELGSLKKFFVTIISKYYETLHPVVWAQIVKNMINNVFIETPSTPDEMFQFASKYLLLNSGPFILKILQMIKPVLTPELITKYNLAKLTYPLMSSNEVDTIMEKIVPSWDLYRVKFNKSASVGHVCIVYRVDNPEQLVVIKIIKPISIVQSCWEYKTLYNLFPGDSCSTDFVRNMLESNGKELNVANEITNLNDGHKYYTTTYESAFNAKINAKLTTIQALKDVPRAGTWYALGMTLAPGIPLGDLIEADLLKHDTIFRAKLHRCLDLTVYKFFQVLITQGFYHGDPHAGNIFFSFEDSQITLIDFGAIGHIDLFANDPSIKALLEIIIMSTFYNYDGILDKMTDLINSKCNDNLSVLIDKNSDAYINFRETLLEIKKTNFMNSNSDKIRSRENENKLFSNNRINQEQNYKISFTKEKPLTINSIYSYLEYEYKKRDPVMFNDQILESDNEKTAEPNNPSIPFSTILEKMIGFYALSGSNIAIKFSEFYELQKAYALLLGVLNKVNYSPSRIASMTKRAILDFKNAGTALSHISTTIDLATIYFKEKTISSEYKKSLGLAQTNVSPRQSLSNNDQKNKNTSDKLNWLKTSLVDLSKNKNVESVKKQLYDTIEKLESETSDTLRNGYYSTKKYAESKNYRQLSLADKMKRGLF